jgi:hypothetical protein
VARRIAVCAAALAAASVPLAADAARPPVRDCAPTEARSVVLSFVRAFNAGEIRRLDRIFAADDGDGDAATPSFQWYSTGPPGARLGRAAYDRTTLARYFRARVRVHEQIRLTRLGAGYDPRRRVVDFSGKLVRSADDLRPRPPQEFKGAADCVAGHPTLIVWSM